MAFTESAQKVSVIAATTFAAADVYKMVSLNASGQAGVALSTGNILPFGVLYGRTSTTSAAGSEAVPVAISGVVKVRLAASTLSAGDYIAASTLGFGVAPSTDGYAAAQILSGSSGNIRVVSAKLLTGPLGAV